MAKEEEKKKGTIVDLREHLFDIIEGVKAGTVESGDAKVIVNAAQSIINSAKVEVEYLKIMGSIGDGSGFIPLESHEQISITPPGPTGAKGE